MSFISDCKDTDFQWETKIYWHFFLKKDYFLDEVGHFPPIYINSALTI